MLRRPFPESTPRPCRRCGGPVGRRFGLATVVCAECRAEAGAERAARKQPARRLPPYPQGAGRNLAHLAWIRTLPCAVRPRCASRDVHAHHVRLGTGGGTGLKPGDAWTVPLCPAHHSELHQVGARTFEARHGLDLRALAERLAQQSPHLKDGP